MPGWQRNIVHTFLADGATMTDPRRVTPPPRRRVPDAGGAADAAARRRGRRRHRRAGRSDRAGRTRRHRRRLSSERPYLGGRVGGWTETLPDGTAVAMNRGFHAFFRQYYNLRNLLRRVDPRAGDADAR